MLMYNLKIGKSIKQTRNQYLLFLLVLTMRIANRTFTCYSHPGLSCHTWAADRQLGPMEVYKPAAVIVILIRLTYPGSLMTSPHPIEVYESMSEALEASNLPCHQPRFLREQNKSQKLRKTNRRAHPQISRETQVNI